MNLAFVEMEQAEVREALNEDGDVVAYFHGYPRVRAGFLLNPGEALPLVGSTFDVQGHAVLVEQVEVASQQHGWPIVTLTGRSTGPAAPAAPWNSGIYVDPDPIPPFDPLGIGSIMPETPAKPEPKPLSRPFGEAPRKVLL